MLVVRDLGGRRVGLIGSVGELAEELEHLEAAPLCLDNEVVSPRLVLDHLVERARERAVLLLDRGDADLELGERSKRVLFGGRDVGHFLARERLELLHAARGRGARFLEGVRRACRAAGEDREVVAAADIDGAFDVNGSLFDEALKASGALHVVFELVQHRCDARLLAWKRERSAVFVRRDGDGRVCRAVG